MSKYCFAAAATAATAGGPAAIATEGATGGRDGGAFGTVSDVCLFTPTAKEGTEVPQLLLRAAGCCETLGLVLIRRV